MEALAGELAAQRATQAQIDRVVGLQRQMEGAHQKKDLPAYYTINAEIHAAINEAAGNPVLSDMFRSLNLRLQSLRFRSNLDQKKWDAAVLEHQAIATALAKRDRTGLAGLLRQHLINKRDIVLKLLEQES